MIKAQYIVEGVLYGKRFATWPEIRENLGRIYLLPRAAR